MITGCASFSTARIAAPAMIDSDTLRTSTGMCTRNGPSRQLRRCGSSPAGTSPCGLFSVYASTGGVSSWKLATVGGGSGSGSSAMLETLLGIAPGSVLAPFRR